jgi:hypothetical protein
LHSEGMQRDELACRPSGTTAKSAATLLATQPTSLRARLRHALMQKVRVDAESS